MRHPNPVTVGICLQNQTSSIGLVNTEYRYVFVAIRLKLSYAHYQAKHPEDVRLDSSH